jgi:HlyD family secretion protein
MTQSRSLFSHTFGWVLVFGPIFLMGILFITVILPSLKDPESKIYASSIGYPALKRFLGQPIKVQTAQVKPRILAKGLAAPGESVALREVDIESLVNGKVTKINIVEGQLVRKGSLLLEIEQEPFQNKVNTITNELAILERDLQSLPKLHQENLVELKAEVERTKQKVVLSQQDLQILPRRQRERLIVLQEDVKNAQAQLDIAQKRLNLLLSFKRDGAITHSELSDAQEIHTTRQGELITAQQQLAQERLDMDLELNEIKKEYTDNQKDLITAQQKLVKYKNTMDKELAIANLNLENKRIELRESLRDLKNSRIYSATDGLVSRVNINEGEIAHLQTSLITLTKNIVFKAYVDQARLNALKIGDMATVNLIAYPGERFTGKVIQLNPTVETDPSKTGKVGTNRQYTYSVWINIENLKMPPGLQGYAQFDQAETNLLIPESSLSHLSAGEGMVMVFERGKAVLKKVKVGRKFNDQREVLEGLKEGQQVVLYPRALNPGDQLKVKTPLI